MAAAAPAKQKGPFSFLGGQQAAAIDEELMGDIIGFSIDQLMELAGLSCAQAVQHFFPRSDTRKRVLIVCGPGNNGGDGLVCGRHLQQFGYEVTIEYPKEPKKELYKRLLQTLRASEVRITEQLNDEDMSSFDLIVDAIFGFSFDPKDGIREPYQSVIKRLVRFQSRIPLASIDIPSGWHVDLGPSALESALALQPQLLLSLTAPKSCARHFQGRWHAMGGRFMPPSLLQRHSLHLPPYPGSAQFVDISDAYRSAGIESSASGTGKKSDENAPTNVASSL